jgi:hypothetical protein
VPLCCRLSVSKGIASSPVAPSLNTTLSAVALQFQVKDRGEVIKFVGNYAASKGQAAALVLYVFFGEPVLRSRCMSMMSSLGLATYVPSALVGLLTVISAFSHVAMSISF